MGPPPFFAEFFHPSETCLFSCLPPAFSKWRFITVKNFAPESHPIGWTRRRSPSFLADVWCIFQGLDVFFRWFFRDSDPMGFYSPFFTTNLGIPSSKLTWQWKFTFSNRKYIFKWWIFQPAMLDYRRVIFFGSFFPATWRFANQRSVSGSVNIHWDDSQHRGHPTLEQLFCKIEVMIPRTWKDEMN